MHKCQLFCHNQGIYLDEFMQVVKHYLFHDGGACCIEISLLIGSENQWSGFYMIRAYVMKESRCSSTIIHKKSVLTWCKAEFGFLCCCFFFFQSSFFFYEYSRFTGQQVKGKAISCYPFSTSTHFTDT